MAKDAAVTPRRAGKPSIYDVAELAGVSHQTVSRVLNDHPNIRESTRQRVIEAMAQVRYTPNSIARALATSRTKRIGVIVDSPEKYGPGSTMRGIEEAARAAGYAVTASTVGDDAGLAVDAAVAHLRIQGVEALCVIAPRYSTLDELRHTTDDVPVLLVKSEPEEDALTVAVDQYAGAVLAVDHLISLGHRDILHVAGPLDWVDARQRSRACADRIAMEGFEVHAPIIGDWSSDFGYRVGRHAPEVDHVTAIFAANDQMALGLLHGLHERGLRVPDDISVIGFDDLPDARHFLPPLSTVRQDFHALGALAMTSLIAAVEGDPEVASRMIEPRLVVRRSTAPLGRSARA
ncbi:LacI family DNA-binding transcriptional regulator [Microbacterium sp.]|uniref:LacI family DNA-binding transcriptional regulator n=1 Tax=Microbacterium sp. TaxID=51671 RepID=UPI0037CCB119